MESNGMRERKEGTACWEKREKRMMKHGRETDRPEKKTQAANNRGERSKLQGLQTLLYFQRPTLFTCILVTELF